MSRSLRPTKQTLFGGLILLSGAVILQGYAAWQAAGNEQTSQLVAGDGSSDPAFLSTGIILFLVVLFILLSDLVLSWHLPAVTVTRKLARSLSLDKWIPVELGLISPWGRPVNVEIMDFVPNDCDVENLPVSMTLVPGKHHLYSYRFCPRRRGPLDMQQCSVRARSLFGFWQIGLTQPVQSDAKVYPDFASVEGYQLLAVDHQTSQLGIKRKPRRGEGQDFHQLREYRVGDSLRQIDWKATSRRQKLISREYQDERDQQIVLMLDSGRRMLTQDGIATHFDHCLNCLLMLSYVALRQGDAVGMMSFGSAIRYSSPIKGAGHITRVINQFYDLYPDKSAPDYLEAAESLMSRYRKRSLVVLATNLRDEDTEDFVAACHLMQRNHVVMVANLRESALDAVLNTPVDGFDQALRYAGTLNYMQQREKVQALLKAQGLYLIDSLPQALTPQLINSYFAIKRAGVL